LLTWIEESEAMFLSFESKEGTYAIRPFLGGVNAISGMPFVPNMATTLKQLNKSERKQDYVVVKPNKSLSQQWLDGARTRRGVVRQFTAVSGASELSIEHQVTGMDTVGGLQFEIIPKHESCCAKFWSSVFSQEELPVPFLATPRDVGLAPGCRVYTTTARDKQFERRMVTVRDIFHDSQTLRATASKRASSDSDLGLDSEASLVLCPFSPIDEALNIDVLCKDLEFFLSLPKPCSATLLYDIALPLAGFRPNSGRILFKGDGIFRYHNTDTLNIMEGDTVEIHEEQIGGAGPDHEIDLAIGAGAEIAQAIVPDTLDPRAWDVKNGILFNVQILDSSNFKRFTGLSPPPLPIEFHTYLKKKYPFLLLKEQDDISTPVKLGNIRPTPTVGPSGPDGNTSSPLPASTDSAGPANPAKRPQSNSESLPPGYCHSCEQVYAHANQ
jgi:hypothetical protein